MKIAVVIPSFRVRKHILDVLMEIGPEVDQIFVVDDQCPEHSGDFVVENNTDSRVKVIYNKTNLGVGGAVINGYRHAVAAEADVIVKLDGDGQMDPKLIPSLIKPIVEGDADYSKGNRFFSPEHVVKMPWLRMIGNSGLSFINKLVSGYWNTMDPTNGFTAIHAQVVQLLPLDVIDKRYFFESDMLFRLGTFRAVVAEVPMRSRYAEEESNLNIWNALVTFPPKFARRLMLRIGYNYFLRDFNVCSLELIAGISCMILGAWYGWTSWSYFSELGKATPTGTVMMSVLPIIIGFQLLLSAISFDVSSVPKKVIYPTLDSTAEMGCDCESRKPSKIQD